MAASAVVPATLLRALSKHAAHDHDDLGEVDEIDLPVGVVLGALQNPTAAAAPSNADAATSVTIWGLLRREADLNDVAPSLPAGISALGHFAVLQRPTDDAAIAECAQRVGEQRTSILNGIVLVFVRASATARLFHVSNAGVTRAIALTTVECLHARDFLASTRYALLRCAFAVSAASREALQREVLRWQSALRLSACDDQLFFRVASSSTVLSTDGVDVTSSGSTSASTLAALLGSPSASAPKSQSSNKTKKSSNKGKKSSAAQAALDAWDDEASSSTSRGGGTDSSASVGSLQTLEYGEIANVEVLASLSAPSSSSPSLGSAPVLMIPDASASVSDADAVQSLHADVLALVSLDTPVCDALRLLREQLSQQLTQLEHRLSNSTGSDTRAEAHHFALCGAAFPLTLVSSPASTDERHATLCESLLQPLHVPRFDPARCSLVRTAALLCASDVLFNVHEGVPASGVAQGEQFLVDGFYGYYHYMQQGVNDKGWGCAYRSLQTLASWMQLNHYAAAGTSALVSAVPTHDEIQRTLVRIGDKPPSFIGSREWIGSMEVGYVLDELFGVSFRSLSAPSGPKLVDLAQELRHHFATQGTPVMIGGGQLAFTLLGIDYSAVSGECAFLILDPHYTGSEDLGVIQTKPLALEGYKAIACGWRRASTFAKNSFYNLCLPQRPQL